MPSATETQGPPPLPRWERPPKTSEKLDWADIKVLDLSTFDDPGGKEKLAEELRDAVHHTGFFSVTGTGLDEREVLRQYEIGQEFFKLPHEEKAIPKYKCDFANGNYFGYREIYEKTIMGTDVKDNVELYNFAKFIPANDSEPRHPWFEPYRPEIEDFSKKALSVASKILQLFALILELPPDYFSSRHSHPSPSDDHLRYMQYRPRPAAEDALVRNTWSRAHTDFGSLTLLWSQNVAGLQILTPEGEWRYVPPVDGGGIICNVGDTLDFWSAGYLRSTTHRVVRPPEDQVNYGNRLGLFYFVRPGNDVDIRPAAGSPLLRRLGLVKDKEEGEGEGQAVSGIEYVRERVKSYHNHKDYADMKGKTFRVGNLEIVDEAA